MSAEEGVEDPLLLKVVRLLRFASYRVGAS